MMGPQPREIEGLWITHLTALCYTVYLLKLINQNKLKVLLIVINNNYHSRHR
jgi:hypothetical protein